MGATDVGLPRILQIGDARESRVNAAPAFTEKQSHLGKLIK